MMQLTQHSAVLGVASAGEAVVMLDASHSARPHQRKIFELAQHVLGQLPGSVGRKLYFLGNSEPYDPAQLSTRSAQWLHENFGRTSLLGPVMRRLDPSAPTKIIVLGAGRIFDLDDWAEHPLFARLALVACGEPLQPPDGPAHEIDSADQGRIVGFLYDPIVKLSIAGPGFMPLWWDNLQYACEIGDGCAQLAAVDAREQRVQVRLLTTRPEEVRAAALTASGAQVHLALHNAPPQPSKRRVIGQLSQVEADLFRHARQRQRYRCPFCCELEDWQEVRCTRGREIFGRRIYESLPDDAAGFVIFRENPSGVQVETCGEQGLLLDATTVAVGDRGKAVLYQFDPRSETWWRDERSQFNQYTCIEEHAYVAFL